MRLAIFDDLPEGGAKRVVFEHVKRLNRDHQVYYLSNNLPTQFPFAKHAHDVFKYDLELWPVKGLGRPLTEFSYEFTYRKAYRQIGRLLNRLNVDVVLIHPSKLTQCPELTRFIKQPSIYFAEEWLRLVYEPEKHPLPPGLKGRYELWRRHLLAKIDKLSVLAATKIVTTSAYTAQRIGWAYGIPVTSLSLGVDVNVFVPAAKRQNYFLFVGTKSDLNGYRLVPKTDDLRVKYITFNKQSFRHSDTQMTALYGKAAATLCLGRNEPFGLAAVESMACGTPVIAIAEGGYLETVINGKTGRLVPAIPEAVAKAMKWAAENPAALDRMGKAGRKHVLTDYSWDAHILQLESVIREVKHD